MTPPDIAAVAGKLTKVERKALDLSVTHDGKVITRVAGRWLDARFSQGLRHGLREKRLSRYWDASFEELTPLGQAVRAHLLGERKDG